ncbi:MAG: transporter substrate-binding domain-containing protein [Deltaproteobacteria bacterium]|jgi:polar amino acid transport system substrate-binding protein|nr:transporter substrate-binding domain-containing protein [Deltaproteobacteria bacterium]
MKKTVVLVLVSVLLLMVVNIAAAGKAMDSILKKGELLVGITGTQPPLNATNKDGKIIGYDADIARLIAMNMGVKVKFSTMPFAKLLPALKAGKVDMVLSSMTMTLERNREVAFVGPYYISGKGIITKTQTISTLQQAEGLNNPEFKVAALKNSTSQSFVEEAAPKAQLVPTKSYDEALDMLLKDKINAIVADYPYCAFAAFRYQEKGLVAGQSKFTFEPLGIAVPEDALLINWLGNFISMFEASGQLKNLNEKWFQDGSWIKELP